LHWRIFAGQPVLSAHFSSCSPAATKRRQIRFAFSSPGGRVQISADGGLQPRWRSDGKEIFFISPDHRLIVVLVNPI
jgi:hypothetical protein